MKQIRTVLVDDELHSTASLALHLKEINESVVVVKCFNKPLEALTYLQHHPAIDLVFLDIEMPGLNGFDLLRKLTDISFDVVFVTAYNQYAINAFKYSAFDYLLKPIDDNDLVQCLERWMTKKHEGVDERQVALLAELFQQQSTVYKKLALPTNDGLEFVQIDQIIRCQSDSNYTNFYFVDGTSLLICRTLKDVEQTLNPHGFIRIHQSHLVNPKFMQKLVKHDGGYLVMTDNSQLRISKDKKNLVANAFNLIQ